jgi:uncharacterized membrane protein YtjA (UPF0391 family)
MLSGLKKCLAKRASSRGYKKRRANKMLRWALIFFIVALVAAALGFGGFAGAAAGVAMILFWVFLAITVIMFLIGLVGGPARPLP